MSTRPFQKRLAEPPCYTCSTPAGFAVSTVLVLSMAVVIFGRVERCDEGILSETRFDKATQRNPRQRHAQCESNFRRHAHDEIGFVSVVQAFNYNFVMHKDGQRDRVTRRCL